MENYSRIKYRLHRQDLNGEKRDLLVKLIEVAPGVYKRVAFGPELGAHELPTIPPKEFAPDKFVKSLHGYERLETR